MAQQKLSVPFLAVLTLGLVAVVAFGALVTKQIRSKYLASHETPAEVVATTPQPTASPTPSATPNIVMQPKVPKPTYPEGWTEYKNDELGFLVAYPDESKTNKTKNQGFGVRELPEKINFYINGADVFGSIEYTKLDILEAERSIIKKLTDLPANITVRNTSDTKIGTKNYSARKIIFKYPSPNSDDIVIFFTKSEKGTYILTWHGYKSDVKESYDNIGESIFKTFQIL